MIEETLIQAGGYGIAILVLWDSHKRLSKSIDGLAEAVRTCPYKQYQPQ